MLAQVRNKDGGFRLGEQATDSHKECEYGGEKFHWDSPSIQGRLPNSPDIETASNAYITYASAARRQNCSTLQLLHAPLLRSALSNL
jgi:hypothetical protein